LSKSNTQIIYWLKYLNESWTYGIWWKSPIIQMSKIPKTLLCICLIICSLLSINEKIWLSINDISSNINSVNNVYCFAKTSCFLSLSGLRSFIDLCNGINYLKCRIVLPILYAIFPMYAIFNFFVLMDQKPYFVWGKIEKE
jgi:hypothetical protein